MLAGRMRALGVPWMCVTPRFESTPLALPPWFSMKAKAANEPSMSGDPSPGPRPTPASALRLVEELRP